MVHVRVFACVAARARPTRYECARVLRTCLLSPVPSSSQLASRREAPSAFARVCAEADHPPDLPADSARGRRRRGLHGGHNVRAGPLSSARRCSLLLSSGVLVVPAFWSSGVRVRVCFTAPQPLCVCPSPLFSCHPLRVLCPQHKAHNPKPTCKNLSGARRGKPLPYTSPTRLGSSLQPPPSSPRLRWRHSHRDPGDRLRTSGVAARPLPMIPITTHTTHPSTTCFSQPVDIRFRADAPTGPRPNPNQPAALAHQ